MAGFTNRGKMIMIGLMLANQNEPTSYKLALCTSAVAPGPDTNVLSDLTEIAVGNGYSAGGTSVARDLTTGFTNLTEDDTNDYSYVQMQDVSFLASGGPIPASGSGARYAVLVDNSSNVIGYMDLLSDQSVSDGQSININNTEFRLEE